MTHVAVGAIYLGIVCQQALLGHQIDERAFQKKSRVVPAGGGLEGDRITPPAQTGGATGRADARPMMPDGVIAG